MSIRCLSVRQPFAWAICSGDKAIENRSWTTKHRGTIAIHAGSNKSNFNTWLKTVDDSDLDTSPFQFSAIIGVADIVDVEELSEEHDDDLWAAGPYCWKLDNARFIESPIPMNGKLNLFRLDDDVLQNLEKQLAEPGPAFDAAETQRMIEAVRPPVAGSLTDKAYTYMVQSDLESAIRVSTKAIELAPELSDAYKYRGIARLGVDESESGVADCSKAIELNPKDDQALLFRAIHYCETGDFEAARSDHSRARKLNPKLDDWEQFCATGNYG